MKPIVKIIDANEGVIKFSKAELEKLLDDIYNAGYQDGQAASKPINEPSLTNPYGYPYPVYYGTGTPSYYPNKYEITCNSTGSDTVKNENIKAYNKTIDPGTLQQENGDWAVECDKPHDLRTYRLVKVSDT